MKELNLEVGQKVWTIQSGYCQLIEIDNDSNYCFITLNKDGRRQCYDKFGRYGDEHFSPSLFESDPFDQSVKSNEMVENKAKLINALIRAIEVVDSAEIEKIAQEKLKKVLETL